MAIARLLVANRGEIALRVFRSCRSLGIGTVAVAAPDDRGSLHARTADELVEIAGYLHSEEHIRAAKEAGADAIHPGYGFLSENADFAEACERRGIRFIGPRSPVVRTMGDKVAAKRLAMEVGVPVVPGVTLEGADAQVLEQARAFFAQHGGPILVKAAHGGGGRGMRVVREEKELESSLASARSEAQSAFGSSAVFLLLGSFAPRRIRTSLPDFTPPAPYTIEDNPDTLLDLTDLVFIDPPFDLGLASEAVAAAAPVVVPGGFVYLEAERPFDDEAVAPYGLRVHRQARAGAVHFHLLQREAAPSDPPAHG